MPFPSNSPYPWYALTVKHHHEKLVAQALEGRGLDVYLPLYRSFHRSGRRMQAVMLPALAGYVFASFDIAKRLPVLAIPSVGSIVCIGRAPAAISIGELENIEKMIQADLNAAPQECFCAGQEVAIASGPLEGLQGTLIASKPNYRLVVSIPLLQRAVSAEVDLGWVRPLKAMPLTTTLVQSTPRAA
jgi:transcription termination/antitermination protein NusG